MNWFGASRCVVVVIGVCIVGCSRQDGSQQPSGAAPSVANRTSVADEAGRPDEFHAASASLTGIDATEAANTTTVRDDAEVAQTAAVESESAGSGSGASAAPPIRIDDPGAAGHAATESESGAEREPLFVGWPEPEVALMLTGRQHGYMEPCGCSGLENQNGGLVRRGTLIKQLRNKGWSVLAIDAGNQVRRFGRQAEIKFQITIESLRTMGYEVVAFGPDDLRLPAPELVGIIAPTGDDPALFVGANVEIFDPSFTSPFRVLEKNGKKIGITAVLGERNQRAINNSEVTMTSAEEGIKKVWTELEQAQCDLYVLIAHTTQEEAVALAKTFPQFKLVVSTGGAGEPTREPEVVNGTDVRIVQVGTKGMFAGVIGLFDDPGQPLRYQRIPLDARFPDSQEMLQLLAAYQDQLKAAGFEGLEVREQPLASGLAFVGSKICDDCHDEEYKIWKEGREKHGEKHAHAYETLQHPPNSRGGIPRNFDPECISCHVVGWNPQKYFPYKSGFLSLEKTPELTGVGCENCHGPGSRHVASEEGELAIDDDELEAIRDSMWLDLEDAEKKCLECHDLDNSPAFQEKGAFERYWRKIEH